jgi:hypothetical protein
MEEVRHRAVQGHSGSIRKKLTPNEFADSRMGDCEGKRGMECSMTANR